MSFQAGNDNFDVSRTSQSSSLDQYARENDLTIDSQGTSFSPAVILNQFRTQRISQLESTSHGLTSDSVLPRLRLPALDLREHLHVPKKSCELLDATLRDKDPDVKVSTGLVFSQYEARRLLNKLKIETVLLPSDPDYDCRELARVIKAQRQARISPSVFPQEVLDNTKDEGPGFPQSAHILGQQLNQTVMEEKLSISKPVLRHLAHALKSDLGDNDRWKWIQGLTARRVPVRRLAVTPPLSPLTSPRQAFIPDADICEVPFASDPVSLLETDLEAARGQVSQIEIENDDSTSSSVTPQLPLLPDSPETAVQVAKLRSRRVQTPLLPSTSSDKGLDIPLLVQTMDIDDILSKPGQVEQATNETISNVDEDLRTIMAASAGSLTRSIEQEYISAAEAIARVRVPVMDFSVPEAEWQMLPMEFRVHFMWLYRALKIHEFPHWKKDRKSDSLLRWVPFLHKIDINGLTNDSISGGSDLDSLRLADAEEVPATANYVWKRPGLAILRESENADEFEQLETIAETNTAQDLSTLCKKRLYEGYTEVDRLEESSSPIALVAPSQNEEAVTAELSKKQEAPIAPNSPTVSNLLSTYMDIHTSKRQRLDKSSFFSGITQTGNSQYTIKPAIHPVQTHRSILSSEANQPQKKTLQDAPCPKISLPDEPTKIIKGLTLDRSLFSRIERLYPTAEIIERDFSRWQELASTVKSASSSTVISPLEAEADIIVSPVTGIIITTLLQVIQRPPPGQKGQSALRNRISHAALRYERLVIIVSEGNIEDETVRNMLASELIAYTEFIGFVSSLDTQGHVMYVGGGERTLAQWVVSQLTCYAHEAAAVQEAILQDETYWEVFMRRTGFNAFAAQAILAQFKSCESDSEKDSRWPEYGLAAFMKMGAKDRVKKFRLLLGGERVLNRVNGILEARWK
ncbi:hypothetical protein GGR57DRAFT_514828 [Xylariaceae sp. FL1272]|nr:hypothetical protein GGR57DRAFT_514828 [Xylariaceae sp. FL1272]